MDAYNAQFFKWIVSEKCILHSFFDFENQDIFAQVHRSYRFCLLTLSHIQNAQMHFAFFLHDSNELSQKDRVIEFSIEDLKKYSPSTLSPPMFMNSKDANLVCKLFETCMHLSQSWNASIERMFSLSDPGDKFKKKFQYDQLPGSEKKDWVRLYCGKAIHQYDHRFASFRDSAWEKVLANEHNDSGFDIDTEYFVRASELESRVQKKGMKWLIGYRDICRATDARTVIASYLPISGCDTTCRNIYLPDKLSGLSYCLLANLNSFVFDYCARQKINGTHLGAGIFEQLPVIPPEHFHSMTPWDLEITLKKWIYPRICELSKSNWEIDADQDLFTEQNPFVWDTSRRYYIQCELDAALFHLYLGNPELWGSNDSSQLLRYFSAPHDAVEYIIETFPVAKRKDIAEYGTYRTKEMILEIFDEMTEAIRTGKPYQTKLDPPPGDIRCTHGYSPAISIPTHSTPPIESAQNILPFRIVDPTPGEKYKTCVPLYDIRAAAGPFEEFQQKSILNWVSFDGNVFNNKMFVAQIAGDSMEPEIPKNSYCLFEKIFLKPPHGKILFVQLRETTDPDSGGKYAVKKCEIVQSINDFGEANIRTRLVSLNANYSPIELTEQSEISVIAKFVKVLK
jgi:SOS-response transcriptional repressor LexA